MTDLLGRVGRAEPFEGEMFKILLMHRSDLSEAGYAMKAARGKHWVAGGLFFKPFDAREYAWRQFRDVEHEMKPQRSDDLHAYLPQWRRVRRLLRRMWRRRSVRHRSECLRVRLHALMRWQSLRRRRLRWILRHL